MYRFVAAAPAFILSAIALLLPANADPFFFSTGNVTNLMASASRPESAGKFEIESADDFVTTAGQTSLTSATFTGLLTGSDPWRGDRRNLPRLSERLECWAHVRPSHFQHPERPNTRELAIGCRILRSLHDLRKP
jgi:hypothetical protein